MVDLARLHQLIEPEARALGFALVRVKFFGGEADPTLQVMAERPDTRQLTIEDCTALSHRLSDLLDREDPIEHAYRLEVSSPGIDRPLTRARDYADWAGHEARITLAEKRDGRKQFKGRLAGIDGEEVLLDDAQGVTHRIPLGAIEDAKLLLTDRLIAATQPLSAAGADEQEIETEDQD
ncbi:MAG: ribosome maturation factor [Proteobacteria bacterium SG_bin5]|nr:ribosome maturation protein RimP [Sphingomonas sp.]OQW42805.1 MAG: ribosome maturation factor [Proteobacteria bacterium SG_bin5]